MRERFTGCVDRPRKWKTFPQTDPEKSQMDFIRFGHRDALRQTTTADTGHRQGHHRFQRVSRADSQRPT